MLMLGCGFHTKGQGGPGTIKQTPATLGNNKIGYWPEGAKTDPSQGLKQSRCFQTDPGNN